MIKKYLQDHYDINRLYSSYLINSDDINLALEEVRGFIQDNILTESDLDRHPDYMHVRKLDNISKNISVDQVRKLQDFLYKTSIISGKKVALIYAADQMNINAANCCLKILEEPTDKTYLFLLTENAANILPTIRSRCAKINHHYADSKKNNIEEKFIKPLLKSISKSEKLSFINSFAAKDRDLWVNFSTNAELLMAKICKKVIGSKVQLSNLEQELLSQFKSESPRYIQTKYEEIKAMIDNVNEFDLDLRASCVLLIDKFRR